MNKYEAEQALLAGKRIRHRFFGDDEWIEARDGCIWTEEGYNAQWFGDEFWTIRSGSNWETGWSVIEPETNNTPPIKV